MNAFLSYSQPSKHCQTFATLCLCVYFSVVNVINAHSICMYVIYTKVFVLCVYIYIYVTAAFVICRAVERLIFLIVLIARLIILITR